MILVARCVWYKIDRRDSCSGGKQAIMFRGQRTASSLIGVLWLVSSIRASELSYLAYHSLDGDIAVRFDESSNVEISIWNRDAHFSIPDDVIVRAEANTELHLPPSLEICSKRLVSNSVKQGWLTSPGFPFGYAYNTTCVYQFEGAKNERIVIAIDTLDLSSASETADRASACTNETDRIVISTKSASNENLQVATLCGAGEAQQFMSASNLLNLTFIATPHVLRTASRGFNITYRFVTDFGLNSGSQVGSACHFIFDSTTSRNGTISSPNFPGDYPHDTECVYEFRGEGHERVQVWLPIFSVEESSECEEKPTSDYLEVQDFPVNSATTLVNRWCSQKTFHRHYRSEGNRATFKFKSNSKNSGVGFDGYYEFISTIQTAQLMSGGRTLQFSVLLLYAALCSSLTVL